LELIFFYGMSYSTDVNTHIHTSTYPYEFMHAYPILMSTFERLDRFDLKIYEVDQRAYRCPLKE
jgi:hypothetical protein